jgi:hypothetical protein
MTANCLWRTDESSGMSCARLPHQARQSPNCNCNGGRTGQNSRDGMRLWMMRDVTGRVDY